MMNTGSLKVTTPTDTDIVMTRTFNAPRPLVWEAMSRPELLKKWLFGPPGWSMIVCDDDPRVGGKFRWVWRNTDGSEMTLSGTYHEVVAPERVVRTERFDSGCDVQGGEQRAKLELAEQGEQTNLTLTVSFPTREARDMAIASGMEHGVAAGYDRLDEMLVKGFAQEAS